MSMSELRVVPLAIPQLDRLLSGITDNGARTRSGPLVPDMGASLPRTRSAAPTDGARWENLLRTLKPLGSASPQPVMPRTSPVVSGSAAAERSTGPNLERLLAGISAGQSRADFGSLFAPPKGASSAASASGGVNTKNGQLTAQRTQQLELIDARTIAVPNAAMSDGRGGVRGPLINSVGDRFLDAEDLARYLRTLGDTHVTAADLVAANPNTHILSGRPVFKIGEPISIAPGASLIAAQAGVDDLQFQGGVSQVWGHGAGPLNVFALIPVDEAGGPDPQNTKIFYSIPGTPIVGTVRPSDQTVSFGLGNTVKVGEFVLFGNVRLEVDPRSLNTAGVSVNGGLLLPLGPRGSTGYAGSLSAPDIVNLDVIRAIHMNIFGRGY
jgi:hypothetical protein